jgi:hypothetical protein
MENAKTYLVPLGRLLMSSLFVWAGFGKLMNPSGTAQYFASYHLPAPDVLVWIVIIIDCARREPNSRSERRQSQTWEMIAAVRNELKNHDAVVTCVIPTNTHDSAHKRARKQLRCQDRNRCTASTASRFSSSTR